MIGGSYTGEFQVRVQATVDVLCTLRLFVRNDDALASSQPVVDVASQLVLAADEMGRRRMVLVELAVRGVVRAARDDLATVLRLGVDRQRADHDAPDVRSAAAARRRVRRTEPYRTRAAHAYVQLAQPLRVLSDISNRFKSSNQIYLPTQNMKETKQTKNQK